MGERFSRRAMLSMTPAIAAAVALKADPAPASPNGIVRNLQPGMAYRKLGRTGFMISEIVMGGNTISPTNYRHVISAVERGLNYLDTAPAYGKGQSELGYAEVLKSVGRDKVFINSKISLWDINRGALFQSIFDSLPGAEQDRFRSKAQDYIAERGSDKPDYFVGYFSDQRNELDQAALANVMEKELGRKIDRERNYKQIILRSVDESLKRLGTDHLDLVMCPHGANTPYELENFPEIFEAFEELKRAGKVGNLGVSAHTDPAGVLNAAIDSGVYSAAMVAYNVVNRKYLDEEIQRAASENFGVIAMKVARAVYPGEGRPAAAADRVRLIDDAVPGNLKTAQKAYVWALRNPHLTAVNSEMVNQQMVDQNLPLAAAKRS